MSRRPQPGSDTTVAALRALHEREGLAGLAELIETALDLRAGPYALTDTERADRAACRVRPLRPGQQPPAGLPPRPSRPPARGGSGVTDRAALDRWIADSGRLLEEITGCPTPPAGPEPSHTGPDGPSTSADEQR